MIKMNKPPPQHRRTLIWFQNACPPVVPQWVQESCRMLLKQTLGLIHPGEFAEDRENFLVHMRNKEIFELRKRVTELEEKLAGKEKRCNDGCQCVGSETACLD